MIEECSSIIANSDNIAYMSIFIFFNRNGKHKKNDADDGNPELGVIGDGNGVKEPVTEPRSFDDVDIDNDDYIRMGKILVKYHDGIKLGVNNHQSLVIKYKESTMLIRAFSQEKHGYRWLHAISLLKTNPDVIVNSDGVFGSELEMRTNAGNVRIIGYDANKWYLIAYISISRFDDRDDVNNIFNDAFRNLVVDRGSEPMAPAEPLRAALPDITSLAPVQGFSFTSEDVDNASKPDGKDNALDDEQMQIFKQELERNLTQLRL